MAKVYQTCNRIVPTVQMKLIFNDLFVICLICGIRLITNSIVKSENSITFGLKIPRNICLIFNNSIAGCRN